MTTKGWPLACFAKPNFEEDGLEFFVCNGGGGIAGVRKKDDAKHLVFVRDRDIARNLNVKAAKVECGTGRFFVAMDQEGDVSLHCDGKELASGRFQVASKVEWARYEKYLNK
jgi:hypothetical protein